MRPQTVQNEVIACLADGHFWTIGELADTIDADVMAVQIEVWDLENRGFVVRFDDEHPTMFGWDVEPQAVERARAWWRPWKRRAS